RDEGGDEGMRRRGMRGMKEGVMLIGWVLLILQPSITHICNARLLQTEKKIASSSFHLARSSLLPLLPLHSPSFIITIHSPPIHTLLLLFNHSFPLPLSLRPFLSPLCPRLPRPTNAQDKRRSPGESPRTDFFPISRPVTIPSCTQPRSK